MPLDAIRQLTSPERSRAQNVRLGAGLAFVAGATNAGAFLAVGQYTSHMTGIVSTMADSVALQRWTIAATSLGALGAFFWGAATTAILVNFAQRRSLSSAYALPLLLEAALLLSFGAFGGQIKAWHSLLAPTTVVLLCFTMGLQNAVITKISRAEIRTTHVTGLVTDLGIEFGKLIYTNRTVRPDQEPVRADRERLRVLSLLLFSFFIGGVLGTVAFQKFGYVSTVPLAAILGLFALVPAVDDVRTAMR